MKDYYKILEVNKDASPEIIAKVYKILAKKYHPDLQDDSNKAESAEKFKEISEAYEILSDENKRKEYDQEFLSSNQEGSIDVSEYENLKNYCIQLENELNEMRNGFSSSNEQSSNYSQSYQQQTYTSQNYSNQAYQQAQQEAYNEAVNKAYHDAYINNLKNMGYKIRYKKTFKENFRNAISLAVTALILFIIFKILWAIPSCRESIMSLFTI